MRIPALLVSIALVPLSSANGQSDASYSIPGHLADRPGETQDLIRERIENAPWQWGRVRVQPSFSIGDLTYVDNVFDSSDDEEDRKVSDLRAKASAGLELFFPIQENSIWFASLQPSYNWWKDQTDLRRVNLSLASGHYGFFNRLTTEVSIKRVETDRSLQNELRIPATIRRDIGLVSAEANLHGPWWIFARGSLTDTSFPNAEEFTDPAPLLGFLDREETRAAFGIEYNIENRFRLALGWEQIDTDFTEDPDDRSSTSDYPFLRLEVPGNKVRFEAQVGLRELEFSSGVDDPRSQEDALGLARLDWDIGHRTKGALYTAKEIIYSAQDSSGVFSSQRTGAAITWGELRDFRVRTFAEVGVDEFASLDPALDRREDDFTAVGLTFFVPLGEKLILRLGVTETDFDSNLNDFDRSQTAILSSVQLDLVDFAF